MDRPQQELKPIRSSTSPLLHLLGQSKAGPEDRQSRFHLHPADESLAFLLSRLLYPEFPEPMGVYYRIEDECYEDLLDRQIDAAKERFGEGSLESLFNSDGVYEID